MMSDARQRHLAAAERHAVAAARHQEAAEFWAERGDGERADLERRNARIEEAAAELERDRATILGRPHAEPGTAH